MKILAFIFTGLLAGFIAGQIVYDGGFGLLGNIMVGIIGSLVGGFVLGLFGKEPSDNFLPELLTSIFGAVVFLGIVNLLF